MKLRSLKNRKQKDLNRKDRQELNTDANIHICKHRDKDYHSRIGCAATDDATPLHLSIPLKLIAFFPSSKTFSSVGRIGQRLTDKPEANFGFILPPLSIRTRLLLRVRGLTKLQQRRQRERLMLRLSGEKLSLSVVEGSLARCTQATMEEPSFHTHFVTKRGKLFTLERKRLARLEGRPALPGHSSRQIFCGRVTPLAEPTPFSSQEPVAFFGHVVLNRAEGGKEWLNSVKARQS